MEAVFSNNMKLNSGFEEFIVSHLNHMRLNIIGCVFNHWRSPGEKLVCRLNVLRSYGGHHPMYSGKFVDLQELKQKLALKIMILII